MSEHLRNGATIYRRWLLMKAVLIAALAGFAAVFLYWGGYWYIAAAICIWQLVGAIVDTKLKMPIVRATWMGDSLDQRKRPIVLL
jgi:uncharacterized membrane protein YjjP (DUF1212 family)